MFCLGLPHSFQLNTEMLRCAARLSLRQLQGQGHLSAAAAGLSYTKSFTSDNQDHYAGEHLLVTEQDQVAEPSAPGGRPPPSPWPQLVASAHAACSQGHMLEMLPSDPGEARRMLRALHRDGTLRETMADRIVRETLEAQAVGGAGAGQG